MQKSGEKEGQKMKITTKLTIENKNQYSFVNVLIFLGNIVLGSKENFDLKGTVLLDFSNIIENIDENINFLLSTFTFIFFIKK